MILIPKDVFDSYAKYLTLKNFSAELHTEYKKWLRFYLDFCDKYPMPESKSERVRLFAEKLGEKNRVRSRGNGQHLLCHFTLKCKKGGKRQRCGNTNVGKRRKCRHGYTATAFCPRFESSEAGSNIQADIQLF